MSSFTERVLRAARLDVGLYEEVEADKGALGQAMTVVVLASIAAGIGGTAEYRATAVIVGTVGALLGWLMWAYLSYIIGVRLLPEPHTQSDWGELLRATGFASAPGVIRILGAFAPLRTVAFLVASVWMLVAMVVAVRQALDYVSTWRAIAVCLIGWVIQAILLVFLFALAGPPGA